MRSHCAFMVAFFISMKPIPLTQGKFAMVDDEDFELLNQWKWYAHKNGNVFYATRCIFKKGKFKSILMHRVILNTPKKLETDHIDGNGLNNQRENLRICTRTENRRNSRLNYNNLCGYKGVKWYSRKGWRAIIYTKKKSIYLGYFETPELAALAYNKAAKKYHKKFSRLNEIL